MTSRAAARDDELQTPSPETRSFSWRSYGSKKAALFRTYRSVAVLQHVRTSYANPGRGAATCTINTNAHLQDVDDDVLRELRGEGFDVVADPDRTPARQEVGE